MGQRHRFAQERLADAQGIGLVDDERTAVEHQFVLAADQIDVNEGQAAFTDPGDGEIEPLVGLVGLERRAVDDDHDFRRRFRQAFGDVLGPHILAHHDAQADAAERHRSRHRPGLKHAFLIKHAVIR